MNAQDRYNSERYLDMTCFLALRNIERNERKERRYRMKENWIYRRGDVYLANLDPYIGSEQGGTRPVVVLQNNTGNYYCPTLIVAPITSKAGKKPSQPTHYYAERIHGLELPGMVLLEQIKTIDRLAGNGLAAHAFCSFYCLDFLARISHQPFVEQISQRGKIVVHAAVCAVHIVVDSDKTHSLLREQHFRVKPYLQVVSP